jgi:hypothetical protein
MIDTYVNLDAAVKALTITEEDLKFMTDHIDGELAKEIIESFTTIAKDSGIRGITHQNNPADELKLHQQIIACINGEIYKDQT